MSKMRVPITYKLSPSGEGVVRSDGASIPDNIGNRDWREYLDWLSHEGHEPEPAFTKKELRDKAKAERKEKLKTKITRGNTKPLEFMLYIWSIVEESHGGSFTVPPELEAQIIEWKEELLELKNIDAPEDLG